jgi:hypothetical protein
VAEILESLDTGSDDDKQIGVRYSRRRECMRQPGRHDGEVPFLGQKQAVAGEELRCATEHVEQLGRRGVVMGIGAVGAALKGDTLSAERPARGRAVGQEPDRLRGESDLLGVLRPDEHRCVVAGRYLRHGTATSVFGAAGGSATTVRTMAAAGVTRK